VVPFMPLPTDLSSSQSIPVNKSITADSTTALSLKHFSV